MITRIQILAIIASLFLVGTTVELIRRRQLEEKYAISWLLACIFFLVCSLNLEIVSFLAKLTGVIVPANFLFLLAFSFLTVVTLSLTVIASKEGQRSRKLAQELSILKFDIERLSKRPEHSSLSEVKEGQDKPGNKEKGRA
ncbi:MAG: DUF2304 domain-containing protein [Candidatus Brocadiales bacterium]